MTLPLEPPSVAAMAVVSSPLERAYETAGPLADWLGVDITIDDVCLTGRSAHPTRATGSRSMPVHDQAGVEAALLRGELVWMKTTVDFKPWRSAVWIMPDGSRHQTVLGNDHAVVVMGFNADEVVIRDVLGPTSSNRQRLYEYTVDWETFLRVWAAQSLDGLAIGRPQ